MTKIEINELYRLMFSDYPDIINIENLQSMLGISRHTAYALIDNGSLSGIKVGKAYRIPKINVIKYVLSVVIHSKTSPVLWSYCNTPFY